MGRRPLAKPIMYTTLFGALCGSAAVIQRFNGDNEAAAAAASAINWPKLKKKVGVIFIFNQFCKRKY